MIKIRGLLNIDKGYFPVGNYYGFPELDCYSDFVGSLNWLSFSERSSSTLYSACGIHFYIDDYCFDSFWNRPSRYVEQLKLFKCVVQPDFSLYYNFPVALQIFNKYRNHWLACYLSFHGVSVIPNINVSTSDCWNWSFLGYPIHSVVAFSDIGSYRCKSDRSVLFSAYDEMIKRLEPRQIIYFSRNVSNIPAECVPVVLPYGK